jgi:hypothetical protein
LLDGGSILLRLLNSGSGSVPGRRLIGLRLGLLGCRGTGVVRVVCSGPSSGLIDLCLWLLGLGGINRSRLVDLCLWLLDLASSVYRGVLVELLLLLLLWLLRLLRLLRLLDGSCSVHGSLLIGPWLRLLYRHAGVDGSRLVGILLWLLSRSTSVDGSRLLLIHLRLGLLLLL